MNAADIEALVARHLGETEDVGARRLAIGHARATYAKELVRQVAEKHGVMVKAVVSDHLATRKQHVVLARAHASAALREAGFSYPQIALKLGMSHHSQAIRGCQKWADHLAGTDKPVTEAQARRASALMRRFGLSIREVAAREEISPLKLKSRLSEMKQRAAREAPATQDSAA